MDTNSFKEAIEELNRASMEPRLFSRGYKIEILEHQQELKLQWSHGFSAVDTQKNRIVNSMKKTSFNGATAFQPWIRPDRPSHARQHRHASMEPRLFSRGYQLREHIEGQTRAASMEPRLFSRGYGATGTGFGSFFGLQWSHGFSAVDTPFGIFLRAEIVELQWSHGFSAVDTRRFTVLDVEAAMLQWSHGFSAVDTRPRGWHFDLDGLLQWSHGFSAVDTSSLVRGRYPARLSFNGATAFQPWIPGPWLLDKADNSIASMEPRLFSRGYCDLLCNGTADHIASMEPRLFSRGYGRW